MIKAIIPSLIILAAAAVTSTFIPSTAIEEPPDIVPPEVPKNLETRQLKWVRVNWQYPIEDTNIVFNIHYSSDLKTWQSLTNLEYFQRSFEFLNIRQTGFVKVQAVRPLL